MWQRDVKIREDVLDEYGKCGEGVKPKCCNCGGNHGVAYW